MITTRAVFVSMAMVPLIGFGMSSLGQASALCAALMNVIEVSPEDAGHIVGSSIDLAAAHDQFLLSASASDGQSAAEWIYLETIAYCLDMTDTPEARSEFAQALAECRKMTQHLGRP